MVLHIGVPGYGAPPWAEWISGGNTQVVIMNPFCGPAPTVDAGYTAQIAAAHAAGVKIIGYVSTGYGPGSTNSWYLPGCVAGGTGGKPLAQAIAEMDAYKAQYPSLDGIFFDECAVDPAAVPYYSTLVTYARGIGLTWCALNPGTHPPAAYDGVADAIMVFENTEAAYLADVPPAWEATATSKLWHVIYGAATSDVGVIASRARSLNASLIYVTDDTMPNPWDAQPLPGTWANLVSSTDPMVPVTTLGAMTQTVNVTQVAPSGTLTWTVTLTNGSGATANLIGRVDCTNPASVATRTVVVVATGLSSYTPEVTNHVQGVVSVPPGGSITWTVTDVMTSGASGSVTNTVVFSVASVPVFTRANTVPIVTVPTTSHVTITKTAAAPTIAPGGTIVWTLTLANPVGSPTGTGRLQDNPFLTSLASRTSSVAATGGATFTPDTTGPIGAYSIPAGGSLVFTINDHVVVAAPDQRMTSTAIITPTAGTGSSSRVDPYVDVRSPVAAVTLTLEPSVPAAFAGDQIHWTLTLSNPSTANVTGRIAAVRPAMVTARAVQSVTPAGGAVFTSESSDSLSGPVTLPPGASVVWVLTDLIWFFAPVATTLTAEARFIRPAAINVATANVAVSRRTSPPPDPCPC